MHQADWIGYAPNSIARLIKKTLKEISGLDEINVDDILKLRMTTTHYFYHTFEAVETEREMPPDVIKSILRHATIDTTSIYLA